MSTSFSSQDIHILGEILNRPLSNAEKLWAEGLLNRLLTAALVSEQAQAAVQTAQTAQTTQTEIPIDNKEEQPQEIGGAI